MNDASGRRALVRELLARLDELLQAAHEQAQALYEYAEAGEVRPWAYRGLYISKEQAQELLAREPAAPALSATRGNSAALDAFGKAALWGAFGQHLGLTAFDVAVSILALAPEIDVRYARLYAYLQDDVTRRRPTVSLALDVLSPSADAKLTERQRFLATSPLIRAGLLTLVPAPDQAHPTLLEHYLKLDDRAVSYLLGQPEDEGPDGCFRVIDPAGRVTPGDSDLEALVPLIVDAKTYLKSLTVYFCGPAGMGQRRAAEELAGSIGVPLVVADLEQPWAKSERFADNLRATLREGALREGLVFLDGFDALATETGGGRQRECSKALAAHVGPVIVSGAAPVAPRAGALDGAIVVEFAAANTARRRDAWSAVVDEHAIPVEEATLDTLAERYPLNLDQIAAAGRAVASNVRWHAGRARSRQPRVVDQLTTAARAQSAGDLGGLAHRIVPRRGWDDLVLPAMTKRQLREICERVRQNRRVLVDWGFEQKLPYGKGTTALFTGPSGSGKTMAAEVVAGDLSLDLFRIDLSQVVSKYIGETEKNLEAVFVAAERTNAILFFDEADALFGKRSEVHDAHDRYANIEVSFLLQRMERYDGVAILATNLRGNLDDAFTRRLAYAVQFPFPDAQLRHEIWTKAWPNLELLDHNVNLQRFAERFKLAGGNIKNVALAAAFLGASLGEKVGERQILSAIAREYQKVGKATSEEELAVQLGPDGAGERARC